MAEAKSGGTSRLATVVAVVDAGDERAPDIELFDSTSGAVQAAVDLQQRRAREGGAAPAIGLAAGELRVVRDGTTEAVEGAPIDEATNLARVADAGQILAGAEVRLLAGSRTGHRFVEIDPILIDGRVDPVALSLIEWSPDTPSTQTLPPALARHRDGSFVARPELFDALSRSWARAAAGEPILVLLRGEAGIGKTSAAAEFAQTLCERGALVLYGRCDEEVAIPYQPFVEAVRDTPSPPDDASLSSADQLAIFDTYRAVLDDLAASRPVVVVVDDLHWATETTIRLLRHIHRPVDEPGLGGRGVTTRLLLLGTYRDTDVDDAYVEAIGADTVLDVAALTPRQARQLLGDDRADLADDLCERTAGNAFFLREMLRELEHGSTLDQIAIPVGARAFAVHRVRQLGEPATALLTVASVIGLRFDEDVLGAAASADAATVADILGRARDAGLVVRRSERGPSHRFTHAIVRDALSDEVRGLRRARLHAAIAGALEARHPDPTADIVAALAHNWAEAAITGTEAQAARWCALAAEQDMRRFAYDEAVRGFARALDHVDLGDAGRRCDLLIALATAELEADGPWRARRDEAWAAARDLRDPARMARAALVASERPPPISGTTDATFVEMIETTLLAVTPDTADHARLLAALARETMTTRDHAAMVATVHDALRSAQACGDRSALADVVLEATWLFRQPELFAERIALIRQLDRLDSDRLTRAQRSTVNNEAAWCALEQGDRAEFDHRRDAVGDGEPATGARRITRTRLAELDRALAYLDADVAALASPAVGGLAAFGAQVLRGELRAASEAMVHLGSGPASGQYIGAAIWGHWHLGDERTARRVLADALEDGFVESQRGPGWLSMGTLALMTAARGGHGYACELLSERLTPFRGRLAVLPWNQPLLPVDAVLGIGAAASGRHDNAASYFDDATALATQLDSPALHLWTGLCQVWALERRGQSADVAARDQLVERVRELEAVLGTGLARAHLGAA